MQVALWLLLAAGPIGAIDVVYFHIWKFRLYSRPQSRWEEICHLVRGAVVPAIFAALLLGRPEGAAFWIVAAIFALDTANSLIDTMIEPASRAPIGVPPAELAVHFIGATLMGAAWATFLIAGWPGRNATTAIVRWAAGTLPAWLPPLAWGGLAIGVLLVIFEAGLVARAKMLR
ncbi:MAG TPA: hypothetical protein VEZ11_10440 [Thermoanaerobaculia bacterium]|nr:hypothetical protein [Thermoanaerobaculia bacterium]